MPSADETNVILLLDLAIENPIDVSVVRAAMPPERTAAKVLRATDFGATRCERGTPDDWQLAITAIDRMVHDARSLEREGMRCRYWVAGRAGLPAFVHLGYRLTRNAAVTLVNPRDGYPPDVLWLDRPRDEAAATPYFTVRSPWPARASVAEVRVRLLVSSRIQISPEQVEAQLPEHERGWPILEAQAPNALDETTVSAARQELDDLMIGLRSWYPGCGALAVIVAGPATLAFLVGRTINPHIFPDLQVFQHRDNRYQLAYATQAPRPPRPQGASDKHTILFLAANPVTTDSLALAEEARTIQDEIDRRGHTGCFAFEPRLAAQPHDLLRHLRALRPAIVHFSGHGHEDGLLFQGVDGLPIAVPAEAIARTFAAIDLMPQLVVLNACYSKSQAEALRGHVDCVVGMTAKIGDSAARSFAMGLYGGLAHGDSVASACQQGCAAIALEGLADQDQPQLIARDGVDVRSLAFAAR